MARTKRRTRVLLVVGIALGVVLTPIVVSAIAPYLSNSGPVDDVTLHAPDGPAATFDEPADANLTAPFPDANTVEYRSSVGNITLSSVGRTNVTVSNVNGTWTNLTAIDATDSSLTANPGDKSALAADGNVTAVAFRDVGLESDGAEIVYSASGSGTITATGLAANQVWAAVSLSGTVVDSGSSSGSGEASISVSSATDEHLILFAYHAPEVNLVSPPDGEQLTSSSLTLEAQVNDSDLPTAQGDEVTADIQVKSPSSSSFSTVGTDTLTSNGTVSTTYDASTGGTYTWRVQVTDSYGGSSTSATRNFTTPSQIPIRNVTSPYNLINDSATAEIIIAGSNQTVAKRTVTDGTISLDGLDLTESYVVSVSTENYYSRAIYLDDIYDQATVFMLNKSAQSTVNDFVLTDNTGQYNDRPKLIIQKIINHTELPDSETGWEWKAVAGDRLGADARLQATLEQGDRYRLLVKNVDGDVRALGEYVAKTDEAVPLTIGTITWPTSDDTIYAVGARELNVSGSNYARFLYTDSENETSRVDLVIHAQDNHSRVLFSGGVDGPIGNYSETVALPSNTSVTWVANWTTTRNGQSYSGIIPIGDVRQAGEIPIEDRWMAPGIYLALIGIMSATPKASARTGAVVVASLGILIWWLGWAPLTGPAVGIAGAIAIIGKAGDYARNM